MRPGVDHAETIVMIEHDARANPGYPARPSLSAAVATSDRREFHARALEVEDLRDRLDDLDLSVVQREMSCRAASRLKRSTVNMAEQSR
jgi:hypothetical protein